VTAPSPALVVSIVALLCLFASGLPVSQGSDRALVCIDVGLSRDDIELLIRDAVEVLRQSGHAPEDYRLALRMERPQGAGFADRRVQSHPSVVFYPEHEHDRYPLRVDRDHPCSVSWVWRPRRFTPWQRRVIERAIDVLRDTWPGRYDEELSRVDVVETAAYVTVHLSQGETDASGQVPSRAEVTLRKSDLSAVD
jgi:hypothetical protein